MLLIGRVGIERVEIIAEARRSCFECVVRRMQQVLRGRLPVGKGSGGGQSSLGVSPLFALLPYCAERDRRDEQDRESEDRFNVEKIR